MNPPLPVQPAWHRPRFSARWAALALALLLANAVWRAVTVNLDLRASGLHTPFEEPLVWEMTSALVVWSLLPMIQAVALNAPWRRVGWARFLGLHLAGCLLFWCLHVAGMWILRIWIYRAAGWGAYDYGQVVYRLPMEGFKDVVGFSLLVLLFHLAESRRLRRERELQAARLESELREARLQVLSAQVDPHFLFNALNTLSALMYEDLPKTDRLITALGQMLRNSLQAGGPTWPLDRELAHLQHYLAFVEARFGDRLQVSQAVDVGLGPLPVPRFALQRLVENAIKHNEDAPGRRLRVWVEARREADRARLSVTDDGVGFITGAPGGVGLENLRRSLALLHGDQGLLETATPAGGGAQVSFRLPVGAALG